MPLFWAVLATSAVSTSTAYLSDLLVPDPKIGQAALALLEQQQHPPAAPPPLVLHVDCTITIKESSSSDDSNLGSKETPFGSVNQAAEAALQKSGTASVVIEIAEGVCYLDAPINLTSTTSLQSIVLRGAGSKSIISGGQPITGWKAAAWPGAAPNSVYVANVAGWPVEIKSLRHSAEVIPRSRFPDLVGQGLVTPNWLFAMPWSTHPPDSDRERHLHGLGLNPAALPPNVSVQDLTGAYAHVLGCVENDVNSQMTKVMTVSKANTSKPLLNIYFRNAFNTNQRFYLENVKWALKPNSFYHDEAAGLLYYWPATRGALPANVVAPTMDRLVDLSWANHHTITNLSFTDTTYYSDGFWDGPAQEPSDAAIRINYCHNVRVEGCNFVGGLTGYGVAIGNTSTQISVTGSLFDSVGQGGVAAYGFDGKGTIPGTGGRQAGNNSQPSYLTVSNNVMQDIGTTLVHVAGVAFRAASFSVVSHNRIVGTPRYGIEADSFYVGEAGLGTSLISRGNILEYNILSDTNKLTTDTGAIEMLGSGDPNVINWWNNNTIRFNNISDTVGSSSSDGKNVCVHGVPDAGCRRLVWGIYLDGGEAGITIHGNIIGSTLHGAVFDNAGGNNTQTNNVFLGDASTPIMMDFGAPGTGAPRAASGNTVKRNIFAWTSSAPGTHSMLASMVGWSPTFLKANGSDFNLFWSPTENASAAPMFPGHQSLAQWQGEAAQSNNPVTCALPGDAGKLAVSTAGCSFGWRYNATDGTVRTGQQYNFPLQQTLNIDCDGNWDNCASGDQDNTRLCLAGVNGIGPAAPAPEVDNQGWHHNKTTGELVAYASGKCITVCYRGGDVGGCNGKDGSVVQLQECAATPAQKWSFDAAGLGGDAAGIPAGVAGTMIRPASAPLLCLAPPPQVAPDSFDRNSIVADPLFLNAKGGNFDLKPDSPAFEKLGWEKIPPITAPAASCGSTAPTGAPSCLSVVLGLATAT